LAREQATLGTTFTGIPFRGRDLESEMNEAITLANMKSDFDFDK